LIAVLLLQGNTRQQWHAVRVTESTVSGISFVKPINCDSCRVTVARSTVDSIRWGNPVAGFWRTILVFVVIPGLIVAYLARGFEEGT
jgi:hypothetical protein